MTVILIVISALYKLLLFTKQTPKPPSKLKDNDQLGFGIIGMGPMGAFVADILQDSGHLVVCANRRDKHYNYHKNRFKIYDLDEMDEFCVESIDIIILAVSISALEEVIKIIPPSVFADKLVVDMCSIKVKSIYTLQLYKITPTFYNMVHRSMHHMLC
jgi:pyrroline-5-carboxylate reductase